MSKDGRSGTQTLGKSWRKFFVGRLKAALSLQLMEKTNRPLHYYANMFREKRPGTKMFFKEGTKAGS